ncbi:biotin carboxylase N-terminal domain-containing protein [Sinomonas sp. ASV322]|uniref:acetyl/propionyl/methylcrotonyl-CoA carboxylase subunit alpha n=1 Tax=Sinomonas sp. ASV322 TaxID=3041920 RepID=UPI0027DBB6D4|nr:biotin carboxylase N-terminal domain-containing protein [Sinomonas sp. ASV322]MDQ4502750.1 biotin carboxylase N-terminal domain-containing protein [Sinomonas sp. ASV322]
MTVSDLRFAKVLVANRGEIACRVIRTLRRLGIRSVAVYSDDDAGARHVHEADEAVRIGPPAALQSYLSIDAILAACRATGADAVHPGYGFLSENEAFARALDDAGIIFVGPGVEALSVMGDKIRAKNHVAGYGVPVVPGIARPGLTDEELMEAADGVGYPLLIKPSAGGGGKGMHVVESRGQLAGALATARRVASAAFGDDTLFLERLIRSPRHIEVQILADHYGTTIHLGERECSLQRRHQKVIEEAPSPLLDTRLGAGTRERIGRAACDAARSVGYAGAGTVEFLVSDDAPDEFFFMEMNTRLQVEHPVTEMVTGVDLVEQQLRVAAGERLALRQEEVRLDGHAIEARIYAEALVETGARSGNSRREFLPATGRIELLSEPDGEGVRVDSALEEGLEIGASYDPLLAKAIAWGPDRASALEKLDAALGAYTVLGVPTNIEYVRLLLADPDVRAGHLDTTLIERRLDSLAFREVGEPELIAAAMLAEHVRESEPALSQEGPCSQEGALSQEGPWRRDAWRVGAPGPRRVALGTPDGGVATVRVARAASGSTAHLAVSLGNGPERAASIAVVGQSLVLQLDPDQDGEPHTYAWAFDPAGRTVYLGDGGWSVALPVLDRSQRLERVLDGARRAALDGKGELPPDVRSPMPGTVVSVAVATGEAVEAGQPLASVEAMKMEHQLVAPFAGVVQLHVAVGSFVRADHVVATVTPQEMTPTEVTPKED